MGGWLGAPDVLAAPRVVIRANVRSALLLAIGVLLLGGVAAVAIHDDEASTTQTASTSTTIGSSDTTGTTGTTGRSSTSSPSAPGSTVTTVAPGSLGTGPGTTEMERAVGEDALAYTGWGPPLGVVLGLLALAAGARAAATATRPL